MQAHQDERLTRGLAVLAGIGNGHIGDRDGSASSISATVAGAASPWNVMNLSPN